MTKLVTFNRKRLIDLIKKTKFKCRIKDGKKRPAMVLAVLTEHKLTKDEKWLLDMILKKHMSGGFNVEIDQKIEEDFDPDDPDIFA